MHTLRRVLEYEYLTVNKRLPPRQYMYRKTLKQRYNMNGINVVIKCNTHERMAMKRHLMVNMTNLRAQTKTGQTGIVIVVWWRRTIYTIIWLN